jgi:O-acetyl-ADP-ribose deacetylase (regulator of RNase III)
VAVSALKVVRGDIFDLDVEMRVNPVNCVGVMGGGLAY